MTPRTLLGIAGIGERSQRGRAVAAGVKAGDPDALEALVEIAASFLAVGRLDAKSWSSMTMPERRACIEAQDRIEARNARRLASLVGLAARPGRAEEMAAEFDGGALREDAAVTAALDAMTQATLARSGRGAA